MVNIFFTEKFVSQFEKLPEKMQTLALKKVNLFKDNQKHPSLNVHKLHGQLSKFYSFSVDMSVRVVFEFGREGEIYLLKIGSHDVYR